MPLRLPLPDPVASHDVHTLDIRETSAAPWGMSAPPRSFVSAHRVHHVLRARFGGRSTGQRGPGYITWQTAEGVLFPLEDPLAVPGSRPIVRADGKEQLYYSYAYVISLLRRVDAAERAARVKRRDHGAAVARGN